MGVLSSQPMKMFFVIALAVLACACQTDAADQFYLGTWKITTAVVAPWADPATRQPATEMKSLVGKIVVIKTNEITGPHALACKGPKYKVVESPVEGLFQGEFDEMRRRDKSVDPAKLAAQVGFHGSKWKTLETGCGNELDFHFMNPGTAEVGLNDFVYTLKKQ
jgi:hypothetical protein